MEKTLIKIEDLERLALKKENENYRFRRFLKNHADEEELDKQFKRLHEKYFRVYDCSKCRNCCKKLGISMTEEELDKICDYLHLDKGSYVEENLNEKYGEYSFKNTKCQFLNEDNSCMVSSCLPITCKEFPYTNKPERLFSLLNIVANAKVCPVIYEILEELKKEYHFR